MRLNYYIFLKHSTGKKKEKNALGNLHTKIIRKKGQEKSSLHSGLSNLGIFSISDVKTRSIERPPVIFCSDRATSLNLLYW